MPANRARPVGPASWNDRFCTVLSKELRDPINDVPREQCPPNQTACPLQVLRRMPQTPFAKPQSANWMNP